ncbi:hypothetical protein PVNG_05130 [Plasmodium vivax North Korean]|uniref:Variable surface protein Vir35 n=1 Tax=Plasmodium vivax North Korean TaxID=1035514 RepID=A0A0J9U2X5_PLAVI|nr:hypothetical protein PVNG_05130 [Plasmodium vivax North Korean]
MYYYIIQGIFSKSLEKKYELDKIWNINFNRILAKHELQRNSGNSNMREKLSSHSVVGKKKYIADQITTNSKLNGKRLNYIDVYMKDYEKRHRKKKGISKLDCYCEKKVFDKIHNVCEFGVMMQNKNPFKKYTIVLILIALIPALGLIFPILFGVKNLWDGTIDNCVHNSHSGNGTAHSGCNTLVLTNCKDILESFGRANGLIFFFIGAIVLLLCIYILIKIIKYKRLMSASG